MRGRFEARCWGLDLRAENGELRFRDPVTRQYLKNLAQATREMDAATKALAVERAEATKATAEATKAIELERAARNREKIARRAAEARIAELEARLRQ